MDMILNPTLFPIWWFECFICVDVCSFVRHHFSEDETMWIDVDVYCGLPSLVVQASIGWAMDLRFPFVFSEDETMRIVGPLGWKRIGNGSSLSLYIQ